MSEMLERVALVIYTAHCANHVPPIKAHWDNDPDGRRLALIDARAAIEAMREPTESMESAGSDPFGCGCPHCAGSSDAWPFMIDAALEN